MNVRPRPSDAERRAKKSADARRRYASDPEKNKAAVRRWQAKNPDRVRRGHTRYQARWTEKLRDYGRANKLRLYYGLTPSGYTDLLALQGGGCAICGGETPNPGGRYMPVDHDAATGRVRGVLCGHCNRGLGCFRDNPDFMRAAIQYLQDPPAPKSGIIGGNQWAITA